MSLPVTQSQNYTNLTATATVKTGTGGMFGIFVASASNTPTIKVSDGAKWGLFRTDGKWITGEIFECDPQLCGWVGGPKFVNYRLDTSFDKR